MMVRHLALGRRVRHRTTRREGVVVDRRPVQGGYYRYMVRWEGYDHDSGEYGVKELDLLSPEFTRGADA